MRLGISDERGDGRPDFGYAARVLYADSVEPSLLPVGGGAIHIRGMGFQTGNSVTVNGVRAQVTGLTATSIDAVVPAMVLPADGADVTVTDLRTGGTTTVYAALFNSDSPVSQLQVVEAPSGDTPAGAGSDVVLRLTDGAGAAVSGAPVTVATVQGSDALAPCAAASCTVVTDASGYVRLTVSALAAGAQVLQASAAAGASAWIRFNAVVPRHTVQPLRAVQYVAAGSNAPVLPAVLVASSGLPAPGIAVAWTVPDAATDNTLQLQAPQTATAQDGTSAAAVLASLGAGQEVDLQACSWPADPVPVCTSVPLRGVAPQDLRLMAVSGNIQTVAGSAMLQPVVLRVTDGAGHGVAGATVAIYQSVTAAQPPCPASGRCPTPRVVGSSSTSVVSDDDGMVRVDPLQWQDTAGSSQMVAVAGTNGYLAWTLLRNP